MTNDEREKPEELGDELPVDPQDFDRVVVPNGVYDAAIAFAKYERLPESDKFNPGLNQASIRYRLENIDPDLDPRLSGTSVSGFGKNLTMVTNGGLDKSYSWKAWCETLGYDPLNPPKASQLQGIPVKIKVTQKPGSEGRINYKVDEVWRRTGIE